MIVLGRWFDFFGLGDNSRDMYFFFVNKIFFLIIFRFERIFVVELWRIVIVIKSWFIIGSKYDNCIVV